MCHYSAIWLAGWLAMFKGGTCAHIPLWSDMQAVLLASEVHASDLRGRHVCFPSEVTTLTLEVTHLGTLKRLI